MKATKLWWIMLGLATAMNFGCAEDSKDEPVDTGSDSDTNIVIDTGSDSNSDSASDSASESDTKEIITAINMDFNNGLGGADRFYLSIPDGSSVVTDTETDTDTNTDTSDVELGPIYSDNNTATEIGGENALVIHANGLNDSDYGFSVEFQLSLDQQTDMRGEDFHISFDIYVPQATFDLGANAQFAFFETANYTPIYSKWFNVAPDQWVTIEANIDTNGDIDYSGFETAPPNDWIFDVVRIKVICNGDTATDGSEILYYVDNVVVSNE